MSTVSISNARENLPDVIETARTEAVILERYGHPAAVVVSPERYEQLMNALDEVDDVNAFDEAMAEEGLNIPWSEVKVDLGWGMTAYRIELRPAAVRALRKLDPHLRPRIQGAIALLAQDPRPPGARPLRGRPGLRIRIGDYRIIYTVQDDVLLIVVVTLGNRRDVYER